MTRIPHIRTAHFTVLSVMLSAIIVTSPAIASESLPLTSASNSDPIVPQDFEEAQPGPVPELSTGTSNTVRNEDGSYTAEISSGPINYQDESGDWIPISNDFVEALGSTYAVENEANDYTVSIPENPAVTPVKFALNDDWVTMKLAGSENVEAEVDGTEASFEDLTPNADEVTYEATDTGVKETIALDVAPVSPFSYRYVLKTSPGITPVLTEDGRIEFRDSADNAQFVMPAASMMDSLSPDPAFSDAVTYTLTQSATEWSLVLKPSFDWLTDPGRTYPVLIDPTVDKIVQKDCFMQQEAPGTTHCGEGIMKVGATNSFQLRRALFDFNIGGIPANATINNATAWIWMDQYSTVGSGGATTYALYNPTSVWGACASWSYTCTGGTWVGGGGGGQISANAVSLGGTASSWQAWDITGRVAGWLNGSYENRGVLLRQTGENVKKVLGFVSSTHSATILRPLLRVTYVDNPPTISPPRLYPTVPGSLTTPTPLIGATVIDPEGLSVAACFSIYDAAWSAVVWSGGCTGWKPSGSELTLQVPSGLLVVGHAYNALAVGVDGVNYSTYTSTPFNVANLQRVISASQEAAFIQSAMSLGVPETAARQAIYDYDLATKMPVDVEIVIDDPSEPLTDSMPAVHETSPSRTSGETPPPGATIVEAPEQTAENGTCASGFKLYQGSEYRRYKSYVGIPLYWLKLKKRWCASPSQHKISSVWVKESYDVTNYATTFITASELTGESDDYFLPADGSNPRSGHLSLRAVKFRYCAINGLPLCYDTNIGQAFNAFWDGRRISWTAPMGY